jgi:hypothetical protein
MPNQPDERATCQTSLTVRTSRVVTIRLQGLQAFEAGIITEEFADHDGQGPHKVFPCGGSGPLPGPGLRFSMPTYVSRSEWERVKNAIDQGFEQYEARWPSRVVS